MKHQPVLVAGLLFVLYWSCKPEQIEPVPPPSANLRIEATIPAKVWDNTTRVYLDATRTNTLNGKRELVFQWSLKNTPAGASVNMLRDSDKPLARLDSPLVIGKYEIELLVADKNNPSTQSKASYQLEILADTLYLYPPRADAGDDRTITAPDNFVILDGLGTYYINPIGRSQTYSWSVVSQPPSSSNISFQAPNRLITEVYSLAEGEYLFRLEVRNEKGLTAYDTVQVTVLPDPLKGTVKVLNDLVWQEIVYEDWGWGTATEVILELSDPTLSEKRIPANTEVRVWIDSTQKWTAPNEYEWYAYSNGMMKIIHPSTDLKEVGKKTKVELRFR
jgi:hypothetical protein